MMRVEFNNLRKQAIEAYERLANKLNDSIRYDESILCMGIGPSEPERHYCFGGTCSSIKKEMDDLRHLLGLIAMTHDTENPDIRDVFSEMFPTNPDDPTQGSSMTIFNPENDEV